ncbi:MAG: hypothetical protein PVG20_03795 [Thioalkalispiraceae bacterium]|jgi:hypothetical protein
MDERIMPADMTLYFDVIKQIQDQINRITYAKQLNEQERLNQLNRLEHEITQKFLWARRSIDIAEAQMAGQPLGQADSAELSEEMDVA